MRWMDGWMKWMDDFTVCLFREEEELTTWLIDL